MAHDFANTDWAGRTIKQVLTSMDPANGCCKSLLIVFADGAEVQFTGCGQYLAWAATPAGAHPTPGGKP